MSTAIDRYDRAYRTPLPIGKVVDNQVDEMLKASVIQEYTSLWAAPVTLTPKKDGSYRFCIDYRKLNAVTVKDSCPLPLMQVIFDQLVAGRGGGGTDVFYPRPQQWLLADSSSPQGSLQNSIYLSQRTVRI